MYAWALWQLVCQVHQSFEVEVGEEMLGWQELSCAWVLGQLVCRVRQKSEVEVGGGMLG